MHLSAYIRRRKFLMAGSACSGVTDHLIRKFLTPCLRTSGDDPQEVWRLEERANDCFGPIVLKNSAEPRFWPAVCMSSVLEGGAAYARVNAMKDLTHWFNAKLHSPAREGWYDCKECKTRHLFKDGLWYRDKKSLRDGPITIQKMHWRGLAKREG